MTFSESHTMRNNRANVDNPRIISRGATNVETNDIVM